MRTVFIFLVVLLPTLAFAESQKIKDYRKAFMSGDYATANSIQRTMDEQEKKESIKVFKEWKKNREAEKKKASAKQEIASIPARKAFAREYETRMLNQGLDVYASTIGKNSTTLKLKFILTSRPLVHKLANDSEFTDKLKAFGFKKIVMTDGYNSSWTVDL